jgi:hypothetical protein
MGPATALILDAKSKWNPGEGSCAGAAVFDDYPLIAGGPRGTSFARARLVLHFKWLCFFRLGSKQTRASVWSHARKFAAAGKNRGSSDRSFGLTFAAFFALVAFLPLLRSSHQPRWWAASIAIVFALLALLWPKRLAVPNRLWLRFGLLLHAVISPIVLALLFYAAIVPIGLLKRIFGNDALRLRADRAADSYWITRDSSDSVPGSMKHQF